MKPSAKPITRIHRPRLAAIMVGSALALALPTAAFATNTTPTAVATMSPTQCYPGDTVTLDGTASHTNPPGGTLQYTWQQQAPATTISLAPNNTAAKATFAAPTPSPAGTDNLAVVFRLQVKDPTLNGQMAIDRTSNLTTTVYALPIANAGPDQTVDQGTTVYLNGSGSTGVNLTYSWTAPAGITLSNATVANPTFTAPQFTAPNGASYTFTLVVTEHRGGGLPDKQSAPDQVVIRVKQPPIAYASAVDAMGNPSNVVPEGNTNESSCLVTTNVMLYGFGSDPDLDMFTYNWTQVHDTSGAPLQNGDTMVALSDNTSPTPSFTAPDVPNGIQQIDLVFQLTVNDGTINSAPSYVTIHVLNTNDPPVAVAAASPSPAPEGATVTLDGSGSSDPNNTISDPHHDILTYTWTQVGASTVSIVPDPLDPSKATFIAPMEETTLSFVLTVSDGDCSTQADPVSITVVQANHQPVAAVLPPVVTVAEGATAHLDGSSSYDPDGAGDTLTYAWTQTDADGPHPVLTTPTSNTTDFVAPTFGPGGGTLHFQLTVTDSHNASSSATVEVDVTYVNHPPTAVATGPAVVNEGDPVHLDGSTSTDPDQNTLSFSWSQVSGPDVVNLMGADTALPTFIAPQVPCGGEPVVMMLTVKDGYGGTDSKNVTINVANVNQLPTATAGANQTVPEGTGPVNLHGDGSDADGEPISFQWTQIGEPDLGPLPSGQDVSFTAPNITGGDPSAPPIILTFRLTVTDSCNGSTTADTTVTVVNVPHAPTAVATGPLTANEGGDNVMLNGSQSSDPDSDPLTYAWMQTAGPTVMLDNPASATPSFATPWVMADTQVTFKLTVSDGFGGTDSKSVTVTIKNWHTPPDANHARADVPVLWPPDHKMAQVHIIGLDNPNNDPVAIDHVTQDEQTNGLGDGDTPIDAVISGDSVLLRAERSGNGNGRVYHVCFTVHDPEQNATGCVTVTVPKSKKTDVAGDGGSLYDSTH
jgi:hypothetical protein